MIRWELRLLQGTFFFLAFFIVIYGLRISSEVQATDACERACEGKQVLHCDGMSYHEARAYCLASPTWAEIRDTRY